MREERILATATIINYVPFIRGFLKGRFGDGPVRLSRLHATDVVRFVQRQAPRLSLKRAKLLTTALRSFLQYARYRGDIQLDLAAAVPVVANWSMSSIPGQLHRIRCAVFWRRSIDTPQSGAVTMPSCSCLHAWGCVPVK